MMAKRIAQFHKVSFEQFAEGIPGHLRRNERRGIKGNLSVDQASRNVQRPDLPDMISIHRSRLRSHQGKQ